MEVELRAGGDGAVVATMRPEAGRVYRVVGQTPGTGRDERVAMLMRQRDRYHDEFVREQADRTAEWLETRRRR